MGNYDVYYLKCMKSKGDKIVYIIVGLAAVWFIFYMVGNYTREVSCLTVGFFVGYTVRAEIFG